MSSFCIHVTALLFRLESANINGLTNPACTSKLCVWNVPGTSTDVKPIKIADMDLKSSKLNKGTVLIILIIIWHCCSIHDFAGMITPISVWLLLF